MVNRPYCFSFPHADINLVIWLINSWSPFSHDLKAGDLLYGPSLKDDSLAHIRMLGSPVVIPGNQKAPGSGSHLRFSESVLFFDPQDFSMNGVEFVFNGFFHEIAPIGHHDELYRNQEDA